MISEEEKLPELAKRLANNLFVELSLASCFTAHVNVFEDSKQVVIDKIRLAISSGMETAYIRGLKKEESF